MSIDAMKQALAALEEINQLSIGENAIALPGEIDAAMDNLRAAIEQPLKINPADCHIRVGEASEPISVGGKEPYDQTSLELCNECGWKAIIPGDGCLVCARQNAKPVAWRWKEVKGEFVGDWVLTEIEPPPYVTESMPLYATPSAVTQKPVAYVDERIHGWPDCFVMEPDPPHTVPLYAAPRQWVGLTDEEREQVINANFATGMWQMAKDIEAKLKEKNT